MIKKAIEGKIVEQDFKKHRISINPDKKFRNTLLDHSKVMVIYPKNFLELYDVLEAKIVEFIKKGLSKKAARKKAWDEVHKEIFKV